MSRPDMQAVIRRRYGSPDVLSLQQVPKPAPGDGDVLIKVHAVSVNAADLELLRARPRYVRFVGFGLFKPKVEILGSDVAGVVEAVGANVERFRPGDAVVGDLFDRGLGCFADYVNVPQTAVLVPKPTALTFEQAAAIPQAGVIALQGLRDQCKTRPGDKVLIVGAGGGAGTFAVQIAKLFGAEVTGVDGPGKQDLMRSIGADHVVDYTRADYTRDGRRYDVILDIVGQRSIFDHRRALNRGGRYAMAGGSTHRLLQAAFVGGGLSLVGGRKMGLLMARPNGEDLALLVDDLVGGGKVRPVIDRVYPLSEVPAALLHLGEGRANGKLVIQVGGGAAPLDPS